VVFVGCDMIRSTGFQPRKGGDMVCIRGPLGIQTAVTRRLLVVRGFDVTDLVWQTVQDSGVSDWRPRRH
jgi:hypothetical protein